MLNRLIILISLLVGAVGAQGQKETSNWFYANSQGVSFNSGSFQPISGIPLNLGFGYNMSVCSDANGNVNFIAAIGQPSKIFDRNYNVLPGPAPNGNVFLSNPLWSKFPGSSSMYYIFYPTPTANNEIFGLSYAVIDMSLNGGLGQITSVDIVVDSVLSRGFCLINKPGSEDFWIINNKYRTDTFYTRLVTSSGVDPQRTISVAGQNPVKYEYNYVSMKASPNGEMLAGAIYTKYAGPFLYLKGNVEVFNFNRLTGMLTSKVISRTNMPNYAPQLNYLEFSPDNRLLYSAESNTNGGLQPCGYSWSKIVQYNLCYSDSISFSDKRVVLADKFVSCSYPYWGNLQTAPNKQIYVRYFENTISTIRYPNRIGTSCNFVFDEYIGTNGIGALLPAFSQAEIRKPIRFNIVYTGGCYPNPINFSLSSYEFDHALWDFGDPGSGAQNTSTLNTPSHIFSAPGVYTVTASLYDVNNVLIEVVTEIVDVKNSTKLLSNLPNDTTLCFGDSLPINLVAYNGFFEWSKTNPGNPAIILLGMLNNITINTAGTYYVKMTQNACTGCILYDSINVSFGTGPVFNLGPDRSLCTGQSIQIGVPDPANNINCVWSTGATTDSILVSTPGQYWVRAQYNNSGCVKTDTINFTVNPVNNFTLPADTILCIGETILLNATIAGAAYLWQDNSTGPTFTVSGPGLYWVRLTLDGCVKSDSINIAYVPGQPVYLGADTSLCSGNTLTLASNVAGTAYQWSSGATTSSIQVNSSGTYWIKVLLPSGCWTSDTINVQFLPTPYFSFGTDTSLCGNATLLLTSAITGASYLWQDNSTTSSFLVNSPGLYWHEVSKDGCSFRDSINVMYLPAPVLNLGVDTSICSGTSILLNAAHPNTVSYLWQDASTNSTYTVSSQGIYFVEVTALNGCKKRDSIIVNTIPLPVFNLGPDTTICSANSLILQTNISGLPHLWSTGSTLASIAVNSSGLYWVQVNSMGCIKKDSVIVLVKPSPVVSLGNDTTLCNSQTLILDASNSNSTYLWQNGSTQSQFSVNLSGTYYVAVNNNGCYAFDTIRIIFNVNPVFSLGPDKTVCGDSPILLNPGITNANYLWQDGSSNSIFLVQQTGRYYVTVSNFCGAFTDSVSIQKGGCVVYVPNSFTPNGDGLNDLFRPLTKGNFTLYEFAVFNKYGEIVFQTNDPARGWDGIFKGKEQNAGTYVWKCIYRIDKLMKNTETGSVILIR